MHRSPQGKKAFRAELENLKVDKRGCNNAALCIAAVWALTVCITASLPNRSPVIAGHIQQGGRGLFTVRSLVSALPRERNGLQRDGEESEPESNP